MPNVFGMLGDEDINEFEGTFEDACVNNLYQDKNQQQILKMIQVRNAV